MVMPQTHKSQKVARRSLRRKVLLTIILLVLCICNAGQCESTSSFDQEWLKAVVSIEVAKNDTEFVPIGTGFLVKPTNRLVYLVTAKHVIAPNGKLEPNLAYRLNDSSGVTVTFHDKNLTTQKFGGWFMSESDDIACRVVAVQPRSDFRSIPTEAFIVTSSIQAGAPALILGFPLGLRSTDYSLPIVRRAMVARVDSNNILVDAFVFPGNSGGPVVYEPALKPGKGLNSTLRSTEGLIGLVISYIPYKDFAVSTQTGRIRSTFEENSGLCSVVSAEALLSLLERKDVIDSESKLLRPRR